MCIQCIIIHDHYKVIVSIYFLKIRGVFLGVDFLQVVLVIKEIAVVIRPRVIGTTRHPVSRKTWQGCRAVAAVVSLDLCAHIAMVFNFDFCQSKCMYILM